MRIKDGLAYVLFLCSKKEQGEAERKYGPGFGDIPRGTTCLFFNSETMEMLATNKPIVGIWRVGQRSYYTLEALIDSPSKRDSAWERGLSTLWDNSRDVWRWLAPEALTSETG